MRNLLLLLLLTPLLAVFAACGPAVETTHIAPEARETRPASPIPFYPECVGAQSLGLVVNAGCTWRCLPQEAQRVCTDEGGRVYFPREYPLLGRYAAILADPSTGCVPGWEIVEVDAKAHHYNDLQFQWVTFPDNGETCVIDEGKKVWGWFGRVQGTLDFHEFKTATLSEVGG